MSLICDITTNLEDLEIWKMWQLEASIEHTLKMDYLWKLETSCVQKSFSLKLTIFVYS